MATEVKAAGIDNAFRADRQKTSDYTGMTDAATARRDLGDKASDMASDVAHKAKEAGDTLMDKASDFGHSMQETGHSLAEKAKHTQNAICDFTRENPTAAVLMAFGVGAVLARILPRR
jgi:ElaB/YqjD/DUF883 family membrane-anchored ribosome-binding protein